jgi:putative heme-binding domain-containing protein
MASSRLTARLGHDEAHERFQAGRVHFQVKCATCHSIDGSGQRRLGPSLHDIGRVGRTRKPGMTSAAYILESILDPGAFRTVDATGGMPQGLLEKPQYVRDVVAFLASMGAHADSREIAALEIPEKLTVPNSDHSLNFDQVQLGEAIFRGTGGCITCHPLQQDPSVTLLGPSLLNVGSLSAQELRRAITDPNERVSPGYTQAIVETKAGGIVQGRLVEQTKDGVYLLVRASDGALETPFIPFAEMEGCGDGGEPFRKLNRTSIMPSVHNVLNAQQIDDLVAFLRNRHGGTMY